VASDVCHGLQILPESLREMIVAIIVGIAVIFAVACVLWLSTLFTRKATFLEELGVAGTLERPSSLPVPKIEAYCEAKDKLRDQYGKDAKDDRWMATMPEQAKHMLKYRLMQRAIAGMACLKKIDGDMRGYWRLFTKGVITRRYWDSVVGIEREVLLEIESIKVEAQFIEPTQDPQGIIQEAMHFIMQYGDKLPSAADIAGSAEDMMEMMKKGPQSQQDLINQLSNMPGMPPRGQNPLVPPGMPGGMPGLPGMPGMPGGARPPGAPGEQDAKQQIGGSGEECNWRQDGDEVEVTVQLPKKTATKAEVKVVMLKHELKVLHCGEVVAEGKLGGSCQPEGSTWTMGKGCVVITLEKADPRPWPALFKPS